MAFIIIYLALVLIVALLASDTTLGFWPGFFLSLILSPVVGFIIYLFYPSRAHRERQEQLLQEQNQLLQQSLSHQRVNNNLTADEVSPTSVMSLVEKLEKLEEVKKKGLIKEDEYNKLREKIMGELA